MVGDLFLFVGGAVDFFFFGVFLVFRMVFFDFRVISLVFLGLLWGGGGFFSRFRIGWGK